MEPKKFVSERSTQIDNEKKFDIQKGDEVDVTYLKEENGEIKFAEIRIDGEFLVKLDLEELEDFLNLFLAESF